VGISINLRTPDFRNRDYTIRKSEIVLLRRYGLIAQNVYLAASALGMASWFHNCNKPEITRVLKLKPNQRALFGQTSAMPKIEQPLANVKRRDKFSAGLLSSVTHQRTGDDESVRVTAAVKPIQCFLSIAANT